MAAPTWKTVHEHHAELIKYFVFPRSSFEYYAVASSAKSSPSAVSVRQLSNVCETRHIIWLAKERERKQNVHIFLTLRAWALVFIKALGMRLLYTYIILYYISITYYYIMSPEYSKSNWIEYLFKNYFLIFII